MPINYPGNDDFLADVRIKSTTDPALGGNDEAANLGLHDLADRTTYLKTRRVEDYRAQVEAASGGRATVLVDANGTWHVMARIPAFISGNFDAQLVYDGGAKYHPAFRLNATVNIPEFLVGLFPISLDPLTGNYHMIPGTLPDLTMTLDNAILEATALGPGWHVMTAHEYGALSLYALARVTNLRGNNSANVMLNGEYGRKTDVAHNNILSGTGSIAWRHDGREWGVSELVGGFREWVNLLKTVNSKLFFPFYNEFWKGTADWDDQLIYFDHSPANDLNINAVVTLNDTWYEKSLSAIEYGADFTAGSLPPALCDPRLCELLLHRGWFTDGAQPVAHWVTFLEGRIGLLRALISTASRYFVRGGRFDDGDNAALPRLESRPVTDVGMQWRLCYIDPALIP